MTATSFDRGRSTSGRRSLSAFTALLMLCVGGYDATAQSSPVALQRAAGPRAVGSWSVSIGGFAFVDESTDTTAGATITVQHVLPYRFALQAQLGLGGADKFFSSLNGWSATAQLGARFYLLPYALTPYVGANVGVLTAQYVGGWTDVGGFFEPSSRDEAERLAAEESYTRFITTATLGIDLSLRSGFYLALEAHAGGALGGDRKALYGASLGAGFRF